MFSVPVLSFATEEDFLNYVSDDARLNTTLAGVIFDSGVENDSLSDHLNVRYRFHDVPINVDPKDDTRFTGM